MKVLLDECVPRQVKRFLEGHAVSTVREMGWAGVKNGRLLALAEQNAFEVFVTADKSMTYQQTIQSRPLGLVTLPTNILPLLGGLAAELKSAVARVKPGQHIPLSFTHP